MKRGVDDGWRWPKAGFGSDELKKVLEEIDSIGSLYEREKPPMCYPGTNLEYLAFHEVYRVVGRLLAKQINQIGCHTQGKLSEGGFKRAQEMEKEVIGWIASVLGGMPDTVDGYFCGGGTEANIQGLWIGREWVRKAHPISREELELGIKPGIVVFTTPLLHYSLVKAVELLGIGQHTRNRDVGTQEFMFDPSGSGLCFVEMDDRGQMSMPALKDAFEEKFLHGYRRFIFAPTVGTCLMGSIDPVPEIARFIADRERDTDAGLYLHIDASFAAYTVPFLNPDFRFGFDVLADQPERLKGMSMTVDADKMGGLPYPSGVFLCRKGLMDFVNRHADYVNGHRDDTVSGSRSALAPVMAWYLYQRFGYDGHKEYVANCIRRRDYLVQLVKVQLPWVKVLPCSPLVNFAPMEIPIDPVKGDIPEQVLGGELLKDYELRSGKLPLRADNPNGEHSTVYKICVMPHHSREQLEQFVRDIAEARRAEIARTHVV
ncbi:MAG: pyridoxal-dependent decarboxylase [Candidatus Falkowbacteria bacterium]